jgi:hypothetical protein
MPCPCFIFEGAGPTARSPPPIELTIEVGHGMPCPYFWSSPQTCFFIQFRTSPSSCEIGILSRLSIFSYQPAKPVGHV